MAEVIFNLDIVQNNNLTYFRGTKTLDSVSYQFSIQLLNKIGSWVLNIDDVLKGVNIVSGVDITKQFKHLAIPQGILEVLDFDEQNRDPDSATFGDRITLKYTEV